MEINLTTTPMQTRTGVKSAKRGGRSGTRSRRGGRGGGSAGASAQSKKPQEPAPVSDTATTSSSPKKSSSKKKAESAPEKEPPPKASKPLPKKKSTHEHPTHPPYREMILHVMEKEPSLSRLSLEQRLLSEYPQLAPTGRKNAIRGVRYYIRQALDRLMLQGSVSVPRGHPHSVRLVAAQ